MSLRTIRQMPIFRRSAGMVGLLAAALCAPIVSAQSSATTHPRLTAQIVDQTVRVPLSGAAPLLAQQATDKGKLSAYETLKDMKLVLRRSPGEQAALRSFLDDVQNAASPSYHKWLTPEQFGERFGASDEDLAAISLWLTSNGMTVDSIATSRTVITFTSTESQFESAFHAEMHHYEIQGETRVANSSVPSVPSALSPAIVGIATLGNAKFNPLHTKPSLATFSNVSGWSVNKRQQANTTQDAQKLAPQFTTSVNGSNYPFVGPADFGVIYGVDGLWNSGVKGNNQSIAIVAESNIAQSDVDAFRKAFGLPATKLNITVIGDDPGLDTSGPEGEAVLDVEWAGALAPEATINLLVAESNKTQTGILTAAEYAIDHNLSAVMDVSWGACELGLGASGNQYFEDLWSQAAAQGISVMVASGDAGSVACDQNQYYSTYGQQVNGIASTEHATAVGGTDFYGNTEGVKKYWTVNNDPTTLQSVKSYITESPWNDSCINPLILLHAADFGFTETTAGALCDNEFALLTTGGGGGGISQCTSSDGATPGSCGGGHPAPAWQQSLPGVGSTGKRHLPDVAMFAGNGLWGSAYAYCEADAGTADMCVNENGTMTALSAGGTSFASPALAGIVALLNQQQGTRQGNINKYLYALASRQYADATLALNCQSGSGADLGSCIFHDVITGTISEPCRAGTLVDPATGALCQAIDNENYIGATPGYAANAGYDLATGLGSLNASLLASNWASAVSTDAASQTSHTLTGPNSVPYGTTTSVAVTVKAASGSNVPSGTVAMLSTESDGSVLAIAGAVLSSGTAHESFNSLLPGAHQLYASYGGDVAFGSSSSPATPFTVAKAATSLAPAASATSVHAPNGSTIVVKVQTAGSALNPTGSIVFTNQTTGKTIGSVQISSITDASSGSSWAIASFLVTESMMVNGSNAIVASYLGDSNYLAAANQTVNINFTPFYTVSSNTPSIDIALGSSQLGTATITIASSTGGKVNPNVLSLACSSITVSGLSCGFTTPVQNTDGSVVSTLTLTANNPQSSVASAQSPGKSGPGQKESFMAILAGSIFLVARRKRWAIKGFIATLSLCMAGALMLSGCAGSHSVTSSAVTNQVTVSSNSVAYGSSLTLSSTLTPVANTVSPSGTVLFYDGATPLGSATVSSGKATLVVSSLAVGAHSVTSSYSGDATFMPSSSPAQVVHVTLATTVGVQVSDSSGNVATLTLPVTIH
ncbi:MAG: peptidase S53 [Acidobacteria bacterium]|nr:peptidase S53 [Acidobacteriota bacterium]